MISVSQKTWTMDVQSLVQSHWSTVFYRPSLERNSTGSKLLFLGDLNNDYEESFQVSLTKGLFKTISSLNCHTDSMSSVSQEIWTMHVLNLSNVTYKWPFQEYLLLQLLYQLKSAVFQENDFFKTIFWVKLSYQLKALSVGRPERWTCRAEFSHVTDKWPFQDHISNMTWTMNVKMLPQCH